MGRDVVETLIRAIHERIGLLEKYRTPAFSSWRHDPLRVAAAEHLLQTAIQALIDVCCHMLSESGRTSSATYAAAVEQWASAFGASDTLNVTLVKMVGLRDLLVHEYGKIIDVAELEKVIASNLGDFRSFIAVVLQSDMFTSKGADAS